MVTSKYMLYREALTIKSLQHIAGIFLISFWITQSPMKYASTTIKLNNIQESLYDSNTGFSKAPSILGYLITYLIGSITFATRLTGSTKKHLNTKSLLETVKWYFGFIVVTKLCYVGGLAALTGR